MRREGGLITCDRQSIIVAAYLFIFGLGMFLKISQHPAMTDSIYSDRTSWYELESPSLSSYNPLTTPAEFQIPPQVARYGSFMFSFVGRGACKIYHTLRDGDALANGHQCTFSLVA